MDLNKAMVIGRLTKDPDGRMTPNGQNVSSFSIATNFTWMDANKQKQEKVEYHNIVVWRKLAEICNQYLKKGSKVYIEGRLQTRSWQDAQGQTKYRTEIIAENMIMLDSRGAQAPSGNNNNSFTPGQNAAPAASMQANTEETAFEQINANQKNSPVQAAAPEEDEIRIEDIPF